MGVRYVIFFQDTNGLSMHGYAPLLGVSERFGYDFCSMAIVRRRARRWAASVVWRRRTGPR